MSAETAAGLFSSGGEDRLFLMEAYWPGVTPERIVAAEIATCRALRDRRTGARLLGSMLVPADELLLSVFAGGAPELIAAAATAAGVPVERVVAIATLERALGGDGPLGLGLGLELGALRTAIKSQLSNASGPRTT